MKNKRLNKKEWQKIEKLLKKPNRNITQIANQYKINRRSIYGYCWRHNIFQKKEKKGFLRKLINWYLSS
jgi:transcriptional regulator with PAS, ATPase and Fis domain